MATKDVHFVDILHHTVLHEAVRQVAQARVYRQDYHPNFFFLNVRKEMSKRQNTGQGYLLGGEPAGVTGSDLTTVENEINSIKAGVTNLSTSYNSTVAIYTNSGIAFPDGTSQTTAATPVGVDSNNNVLITDGTIGGNQQSVMIGDNSGHSQDGYNQGMNTFIGAYSGQDGQGRSNTFIGRGVGMNIQGSENCYIGYPKTNTTESQMLRIGGAWYELMTGKVHSTGHYLRFNTNHLECDVANIPTSYSSTHADRIWKAGGVLMVGNNTAPSGGGSSLGFTPLFEQAYRGSTDRNSLTTILSGSFNTGKLEPRLFNGNLGNEDISGWGTGWIAWKWADGTARCFNELTIWINGGATGSSGDSFRSTVLKVYGSNDATTATNGTWVHLNSTAQTVWLHEAIACKSYIWTQYSQMYPQGWTFRLTTNMNNYKCYRVQCVGGSGFSTSYGLYDFTMDYKKIHEVDYT